MDTRLFQGPRAHAAIVRPDHSAADRLRGHAARSSASLSVRRAWWCRRAGAGAEVHAVLAGQARDRDPEATQLDGSKLEAGKGRGIAGHVISLRRSGTAAKLSNKGRFSGQK